MSDPRGEMDDYDRAITALELDVERLAKMHPEFQRARASALGALQQLRDEAVAARSAR